MNAQAPVTRVCRKCGEEKPFERFLKNPKCYFGRAHICKPCKNRLEKQRAQRFDIAEAPKEKVCHTCKETKLLAEFVRSSFAKFGRQNVCKKCKNTQRAEYRQKDRDDPAWREREKRRQREWKKKNPLSHAISRIKQYDRKVGRDSKDIPQALLEVRAFNNLIRNELKKQKGI